MSLQSELVAIQKLGKKQRKSEDFISFAILFWMEMHLDFSLKKMDVNGNSFPEKEKIEELKKFLFQANIIGWYNRNSNMA